MTSGLDEAVPYIRSKSNLVPRVAVILGSGLGKVGQTLERGIRIPYATIPGFSSTTVPGHEGELFLGLLASIGVIVLSGRFHLYEGLSAPEIVKPVRLAAALGARSIVTTNAAGAVNANFKPGELMLITDHINLTGQNPLVGNPVPERERFIDMSEAYAPDFIAVAEKAAWRVGVAVRKGVYLGVLGPSYETPAEIRMARILGADAVGMSTVLEVVAARQLGLRVLGISCLTNMAAGVTQKKLDHASVLTASSQAADALSELILNVAPEIAKGAPK